MSIDRWTDTEGGLLLRHKKWNDAICSNMDGPGDDHTKWSKSEKDKHHRTSLVWNLKYDTNELIYKTETDSQTENRLTVTKGEGVGEG